MKYYIHHKEHNEPERESNNRGNTGVVPVQAGVPSVFISS